MARALAAYQDAFAAALLGDVPARDAPSVARLVQQPGFAVYRNTVMKGCIDALQANFPTVDRLVGDEWFRAAAAVYARTHLPSQPSLLVYGETFADFLAAFEPAQDVPYLAAVARVDRLWTEAHVAADETALDPAQLAALPPPRMSHFALRPHAAARWYCSDEWPLFTLWSRNRADGDGVDAPFDWVGEGVLVTRPVGAVQAEPLAPAGAALLDACAAGTSIETAVLAALDAQPATDVAILIHQLLQAGAFSGLRALS